MSLVELSSLSTALADLTAQASERTIAIRGADGRTLSGFIWRTGLAVTADEVLEGDDEVDVVTPDGTLRKAQLAGRDPATDVVLLKLETAEHPDWVVADTPRVGSLAMVVGRADSSALASLATVSEVGPAWRSMRGGEIDARITLGLRLSSRAEGSVVVDPGGGLLGMAVTGVRRRALAIPASTIARSVKSLSEIGYVPRGWLGVSLHGLGEATGVIAVGIEQGSPAAAGGLLVGDIVTTWSGEPVASVAEIAERLGNGTVGKNIKLGVLRGGNALELDVVIGERPRA